MSGKLGRDHFVRRKLQRVHATHATYPFAALYCCVLGWCRHEH